MKANHIMTDLPEHKPEDNVDDLIARARAAAPRAYCPYSQFRVGAALLTDTGDVYAACNVENASYGLSVCAERNAVFQMVAAGARGIVAIAVYTPTPTPAAPCGACRQVMNEFGPNVRVVCVCDGEERIDTTLDRLLPTAFGPRNLE
jgi:cytidine deaminase